MRVYMEGMDLAETLAYIRHHLGLAGWSDPLSATTLSPPPTRAVACPGLGMTSRAGPTVMA